MANKKKKSNRSAMKRFRVSGTGKIKRAKAYKNHILTKKSAKRKAKLAQAAYVHEADAPRIQRLLLLK